MATYSVTATNWATAVENKIHDDEVARRYGFGGGLVPGVTLYAYITRPLVDTWGREGLQRGRADVRFVSPVYDGQRITMTLDDGRIGQEVRTMARVTENIERKGHRFVRLDVVTTADGIPASVVDHTAIWSVRPST